jgi:hypothetical protein
MRFSRMMIAAALIASPAGPALACELDGPGGHRFFAFAGMYRGGQAQGEPEANARKDAPAKEQSRSDEQEQPKEGPTGSDDAGTGDPATFR